MISKAFKVTQQHSCLCYCSSFFDLLHIFKMLCNWLRATYQYNWLCATYQYNWLCATYQYNWLRATYKYLEKHMITT